MPSAPGGTFQACSRLFFSETLKRPSRDVCADSAFRRALLGGPMLIPAEETVSSVTRLYRGTWTDSLLLRDLLRRGPLSFYAAGSRGSAVTRNVLAPLSTISTLPRRWRLPASRRRNVHTRGHTHTHAHARTHGCAHTHPTHDRGSHDAGGEAPSPPRASATFCPPPGPGFTHSRKSPPTGEALSSPLCRGTRLLLDTVSAQIDIVRAALRTRSQGSHQGGRRGCRRLANVCPARPS